MPIQNKISSDIYIITPELIEALLQGELPYDLDPKKR